MKQVQELPLTENCHHWRKISEVPWDLQKYWQQRHTIFSYYNEGIYMTHDAWYGVTPEPVANQIAHDLSLIISEDKTTIIDVFAGVGANSIAFALSGRWERVIAVEKDAATLACAQHNASIYGVANSISWILGDNFEYLDALNSSDSSSLEPDLQVNIKSTVVFGSPPWGGPGYRTDEVFDLSTMEPYNLTKMHESYRMMDHALYLPRTSDLRQIAHLAPEGSKIEVVQYCVEGASKAMVAYLLAEKGAEVEEEKNSNA
ncbi:RNA cap guanine-N2 methyltransferase-domain-containing protein [Pseudomassariella vexata]|uniref:Trimethylguanosine synthase n=1 Tax=Pseudomassariella vexata TaxID=1141098 RepID=A0A1Y2E399_9PEZI|nr:RNA cap guanine-N2 methyltransferase-domain-containing protein [Pseudomassariella vexata]ORY65979.1 RNA cap guanine-N2 methyltransferase-domain-containing protein [Pseudomassariella vexata]